MNYVRKYWIFCLIQSLFLLHQSRHFLVHGLQREFDESTGIGNNNYNNNNEMNSFTGGRPEQFKPGEIRTATGGLINTLMVTLTIFAFIANGAFLIYVFWLSNMSR